ncbi:PPR domain protein [Ceratobasidium sp. AG-Ba]|nr:PPR domain protein [Ceratobasidium sp. AG-Ba]
MQLYRSEGKDEEVLRTFQSIFSPIGITPPLTDALGLMQPSSVPPKKRLWPSSEALALASWSAARLAARSKDNGLLERCYSLFLEGCNPGPNGMFELPPTMRPDAAAFQPWVGAFAWTSGPQGVIRIMGDMRQRRISPSVMTWNALAKAYKQRMDRRQVYTEKDGGVPHAAWIQIVQTNPNTPPESTRSTTRLGIPRA